MGGQLTAFPRFGRMQPAYTAGGQPRTLSAAWLVGMCRGLQARRNAHRHVVGLEYGPSRQ